MCFRSKKGEVHVKYRTHRREMKAGCFTRKGVEAGWEIVLQFVMVASVTI